MILKSLLMGMVGGAAGVITFVGQYQLQLFWGGLTSNVGGVLYIGSRVAQFAGINWNI